MNPLVSVGVPVFQGKELDQTLRCLQRQTYPNLEIIISIDAGDQASFDLCQPFLRDNRFRLYLQSSRLGWAGNTNWLINKCNGTYFCFFQQDDLADVAYFEELERCLRFDQAACVSYSYLRWFGAVSGYVAERPLIGDRIRRVGMHIQQMGWVPMQGLIRTSAIRQAGLLRETEFESCLEEQVWLTKLACVGHFVLVPQFLYYKRNHLSATHRAWHGWPPEQRMNAWIVCIAGIAETVLSIANTRSDRWSLMSLVFARLIKESRDSWCLFEFDTLADGQLFDIIEHFNDRLISRGFHLGDQLGVNWRQIAHSIIDGRDRSPALVISETT